ncbi:hypothetical protein [Longispora urticae]
MATQGARAGVVGAVVASESDDEPPVERVDSGRRLVATAAPRPVRLNHPPGRRHRLHHNRRTIDGYEVSRARQPHPQPDQRGDGGVGRSARAGHPAHPTLPRPGLQHVLGEQIARPPDSWAGDRWHRFVVDSA